MDIPGYSPTRRIEQTDAGFIVYVKPQAFVGTPEVSVFLTPGQFDRYEQWRDGALTIQEALSELPVSEREMLMTGLGDEDFKRIASDWDE